MRVAVAARDAKIVDGHTRLAYSEVLPNEKGTSCAGFLERANGKLVVSRHEHDSRYRLAPKRLERSPARVDGLVLVRVGLDGTDREINAGEYGAAPPGSDVLVLGHESLDTTAVYTHASAEDLARRLERTAFNLDG